VGKQITCIRDFNDVIIHTNSVTETDGAAGCLSFLPGVKIWSMAGFKAIYGVVLAGSSKIVSDFLARVIAT